MLPRRKERRNPHGAEKAKTSYETAMQIATAQLTGTDPIYLGLALNYSVFLYELVDRKQEAINLTDNAFKQAIEYDEFTEEEYIGNALPLQLLKDNVALWSEEQAENKQPHSGRAHKILQ
jgi:14-3-3 protein epsilon